jgi:site-specific DNA recombinase
MTAAPAGEPAALPMAAAAGAVPVDPAPGGVRTPVAFVARVSTDDQQDPTLSLPRQLVNCQAALPPGWYVAAWFWDIESGRLDLERRGRGRAQERLSVRVPRDGGLLDLMAEAEQPGRRFEAVICESIDRLARRTHISTRLEHELERRGVRIYAADEPINPGGKQSTTVLTRRLKQGVAEWYVMDLLERSWDGLKIHTAQGWNVGKPPYGYLADKVTHPVPARAADGRTKTRLLPDPVCGPVVTEIFRLRAVERLSYRAIADRLNTDPAAYPPPQPTRTWATRGEWTASSTREILCNPKYTGHMVWNRRSTKNGGRNVPPADWVWSSTPTHEPLVTRARFAAAGRVAAQSRGTRQRAGANPHPQTRRIYPLRSYVFCGDCGRRMHGCTRGGRAYYRCDPSPTAPTSRHPSGTPKTRWVAEEPLLAHVYAALSSHVLSPSTGPRDRLQDALRQAQQRQQKTNSRRIRQLTNTIAELTARQNRLIAEMETNDTPDSALHDRIRQRFNELHDQRRDTERHLAEAKASATAPAANLPDQAAVSADLHAVPEDLQRNLYDLLQLQVHYHHPGRLRVRIVIPKPTTQAS